MIDISSYCTIDDFKLLIPETDMRSMPSATAFHLTDKFHGSVRACYIKKLPDAINASLFDLPADDYRPIVLDSFHRRYVVGHSSLESSILATLDDSNVKSILVECVEQPSSTQYFIYCTSDKN